MDVEDSHRRGRLGSGGERNAKEHVSRNIHRGNGEIQEWERGSRQGGEHIKHCGQQVMSDRLCE